MGPRTSTATGALNDCCMDVAAKSTRSLNSSSVSSHPTPLPTTSPVGGGSGETISTVVVDLATVVVVETTLEAVAVTGAVGGVVAEVVDPPWEPPDVHETALKARIKVTKTSRFISFEATQRRTPIGANRGQTVWVSSNVGPVSEVRFARLTEAPFDDLLRLLNEPRNARHMPLSEPFTSDEARDWIAGKDSRWEEHGYGPWAIFLGEEFAGWGGFQLEENGADYGLVLLPEFWGHGREITLQALDRGFDELGLEEVLIALPPDAEPGPGRRQARLRTRW